MNGIDRYLERKRRETALIAGCLSDPPPFNPPDGAQAAIEVKFRLAGALRAERSLQSWTITETARPEVQRWRSGAYEFSFGYQRADLRVRGPSLYEPASVSRVAAREEILYTVSGMGAIAAVLTALVRLHATLEVIAPRGCYNETRELLRSLAPSVTVVPPAIHASRKGTTTFRVLLLDSCVSSGFGDYRRISNRDVDLVLFDTTCFWRDSSRIRIAIDWALQSKRPMILVRSHAKLDSVGIEYGRLGSVAFLAHPDVWASLGQLRRQAETSIRLYGLAAIPAHFPPFTGAAEYGEMSRTRTASIIRSTRRIARCLRSQLARRDAVREFRHGLYLALVPREELQAKDVKRAAAHLGSALSAQRLPVRHAGSFGFDFIAVECFYDAIVGRNVIRVAGADLPPAVVDRIADAIAAWWSHQWPRMRPQRVERVLGAQGATAT
jgi:hypothetical protein